MNPVFVFFGTPDIAVTALETLARAGMSPARIVTAPDAPRGRGLTLSPSPVAQWAAAHGTPVSMPEKLSDPAFVSLLHSVGADLFVVVAYGKILPQSVLSIPRLGTLNMHPSLLPRHRGPSPVESQILHETDRSNVGVSVMLLDEAMDHGPVLTEKNIADALPQWPVSASALRSLLAQHGARLLAETLPAFIAGKIQPQPQDDTRATYCTRISKEDALIDLSAPPEETYKKILAYDIWPRAYFFTEKNGKRIRVIVTRAHLADGALVIDSVIPEGKKETSYKNFLSSNLKTNGPPPLTR